MFVAIIMARNEEDVLPTNIGHLLYTIGVDKIFVADNGSTDKTRQILERIRDLDERVTWTDATGPYDQQEVVNGLYQEALKFGAKWLLPTDADEFYFFRNSIRDLDRMGVGAWDLPLYNFAQFWTEKSETPKSLGRMIFRVPQIGTSLNAQGLVTSKEISFLQMVYPPKLILRGHPDIIIHKGNHSAEGIRGELLACGFADILHAPIRSRHSIFRRKLNAGRLRSSDPTSSWHLKRLLPLAKEEDIESEWQTNSVDKFLRIGQRGNKSFVKLDLRLANIWKKQKSFVESVLSDLN